MIALGKVVEISYQLKNQAGEMIDQSTPGDPLLYLHGRGQIISGLENALVGLKVGDQKHIEVTPENGYGPVLEDLKVSVQRSQFPKEMKIEKGARVQSSSPDGHSLVFTVTDIQGDTIFLDGNHPMAGQTLFFDIEVLKIRDATPEELTHGHAHGGDGHHH